MKIKDVIFFTDDFRFLKNLAELVDSLKKGTQFYMTGTLENGRDVSTSCVTCLMANAAGLVVTTKSGSVYQVTTLK